MCLFPRLIENKKYKPNKKNNYNPPVLEDERVRYVSVGCGNCIECQKQKTREWQVRLNEEIREYKNGKFITLTFSNDKIEELLEVVKDISLNDYAISNKIATLGVRRFLERWRKKYKKSVRHWFTTELGDENDRLHLHGILFTNVENDEIEKIWSYGNIWVGEYVNEKTINYIIKYVGKINENHKNYKPKILASKGIGSGYIKRRDSENNRYKENETKEYYKTRTGIKLALPIYYRNKIYTDDEKERLWIEKIEDKKTWVMGERVKLNDDKGLKEYEDLLKYYRKLNKRLGFGDDESDYDEKEYNRKLRYLNHVKKEKIRLENLENKNIDYNFDDIMKKGYKYDDVIS